MERSITIRSIRIKRPISTGAGCHAGHVSGFVLTHFGFLSEGADLRTSMRTREREKMRFAQEIDMSISKEWRPGTSAKTKAHFSPIYICIVGPATRYARVAAVAWRAGGPIQSWSSRQAAPAGWKTASQSSRTSQAELTPASVAPVAPPRHVHCM